ncbi:MAG: HAMP domain-containing sensor histidine kinase, partial [Candidatus Aminicenantes bacterium]|nr:HAMP domain-containing sensor histidine kinase [Candidatus Aminicenantes bacterium]
MRLPWEDEPAFSRKSAASGGRDFAADLRRLEKAEFADRDPVQAAKLGQAMLKTGLAPEQEAVTRLAVARSLSKAGRAGESAAMARALLALPAEVQDEFRIPYSLYAAERLANSESDQAAICAALDPAVYPWGRLMPGATLQALDLFAKLKTSSISEVRKRSAAAMTVLRDLPQKQKLAEVLKIQSRHPDRADELPEKIAAARETWSLFGPGPWFVSWAEAAGDREILVACEAGAAFNTALAAVGGSAGSAAGSVLGELQVPGGLPLGPAFPNARIVIPSTWAAPPDPSNSRSAIYLLMAGLALGLAIFGSILFWRDVRRDLETAELRSQFVASVSHELKTPLAAIRMFAETLRLNRLREPAKKDEYLDTIINESERLDRLIANVLDFSKIEKGRRSYRFARIAVSDVLASAARVMEYPLRQKGFRLRLSVADDIPEINGDRDALLQAVLNLLDNAVKYSGEAREIDLSLEKTEAAAVIRVRDRGIGIPAAEQKRVFEKFHRVPDPRNDGIVGAGLGLA